MPKVIDNYVLQDKIGSGQFGDVFSGFNQQTQMQVAIKTIKRQTIKGKFYQLLQNQIKVLKTCDNPHIMKLYALKRTANHYYLILQYCNGGDMFGKLKKQKRIPQQKAIKYFCQILTGFQTLVKHKIMHRDFKLANILLHDDNIKIADFGFSKLLNTQDYTSTMLGSPLNMAPEVLGGNKYNNKADIWSIGACIYEMVVGKPPYMANNMVDLLKIINTKPLTFPNDMKINPTLLDCLKKMLIPDVKKRISWNDLFAHPINRYLANQIRKQIDLQLIDDESLMLNTSKFYLKNNLVIKNIQDIQNKQIINQQLHNIINKGQKSKIYYQQSQKQQHQSNNQQNYSQNKQISKINQSQIQSQQQQTPIIQKKWKKNQPSTINLSYIYRKNSKQILYHRNIYAFFATIADEIITFNCESSQLAALVLIKKILSTIKWLLNILQSQSLQSQQLLPHIQQWQQYKKQNQFKQVKQYIEKQYNVFSIYCESLQSTIKSKIINGQLGQQAKNIITNINVNANSNININDKSNDPHFYHTLHKYLKSFTKDTITKTLNVKNYELFSAQWKHIQKLLICLNYQQQFTNNNNNVKIGKQINANKSLKYYQFDFNKFYQQQNNIKPDEILKNIQIKLSKIIKK